MPVYHGSVKIDMREIEISATSRAEAVLKWLDYLNANIKVTDEYERLYEVYLDLADDYTTEEELIKSIIEVMFEDEVLWLEEKI